MNATNAIEADNSVPGPAVPGTVLTGETEGPDLRHLLWPFGQLLRQFCMLKHQAHP